MRMRGENRTQTPNAVNTPYAELLRLNSWPAMYRSALRHMEAKMDFAFLTAVGPILALTIGSFFLAFVSEFSSGRRTLGDLLLKD
jgi:hypothetical protein